MCVCVSGLAMHTTVLRTVKSYQCKPTGEGEYTVKVTMGGVTTEETNDDMIPITNKAFEPAAAFGSLGAANALTKCGHICTSRH